MKKIYCSFAFCFAFFAGISQIPTGSLVGYWPFSGNANDLSGNSNNGTVTGATLTTDRFGNCDQAYYLNGTGNKIAVPNNASIDMSNTQDFTACFWMNTMSGNTISATMLCKNAYGSNTGYQFFSDPVSYCNNFPGQLSFYTAPSAAACSNTNVAAPVNNNIWYFIAGVYNGANNTASLYVNGVLQTQTGLRSGNLSSTVALNFGCQSNNTEFYKGKLDDIRIYKRMLNQSEITALYNEANPVYVNNTTPASNQTVCAGNSATLTANAGTNSINWYTSPSSTVVVGTGTAFVTSTLSAGVYTFYTRPVDCGGPSTLVITPVTVTVSVCNSLQKFANQDLQVNLFPNPTTGYLTVEAAQKGSIQVRNIFGQLIISANVSAGKNAFSIESLENGVYLVEVKQENGTRSFKVIKE